MSESQAQETFRVTVTGVGIEIEREVSANRLPLIMSAIMGTDFPNGQTDSMSVTQKVFDSSSRMSLREFLDEVKATRKPDQIVAIGQYMALHEKRDTFTRDDIKTRFQSAREPLPANFPRDFGVAITKGMIAEDHSQHGVFYVTRTGARAVEQRFGAKE